MSVVTERRRHINALRQMRREARNQEPAARASFEAAQAAVITYEPMTVRASDLHVGDVIVISPREQFTIVHLKKVFGYPAWTSTGYWEGTSRRADLGISWSRRVSILRPVIDEPVTPPQFYAFDLAQFGIMQEASKV